MPDAPPTAPDPFDALRFDNSFVRELPADPERANRRRQVRAAFSRVEPTPVAAPKMLAWVPEVAELVGLPASPSPEAAEAMAAVFGGNRVHDGMDPYAACYGGHQFGNWAGQLGDGRAITLGEVLGEGDARWELQLKGAGPTPYSRMGDGRAVLRSSIRELVCSEAMFHLGVPTTRALCLVGTGESVERDMLYDGNPRAEPGAIVCRVAPSFLRFGNFELPASRDDEAALRTLTDYAIARHYPEFAAPADRDNGPDEYAALFTEVCRRTAQMVAHWQRVGFVHGVMNTDNMSILGLTIDYGPYGWLENYDPDWTPNTTDASTRRYRFGMQPRIAGWNLLRFGSALHPLVGEAEKLQAGMNAYAASLERATLDAFARKLGLTEIRIDEDPEDPRSDAWLVNEHLRVLDQTETDMTLFYRALPDVSVAEAFDGPRAAALADAYYTPRAEHPPELVTRTEAWLDRYAQRVREDDLEPEARRARMNAANPRYVPRNWLVQLAIDRAEEGDPSGVLELLDVLRRPYEDQPGRDEYAAKRPEWARHRVGCSMLSCSS